MSHLDALQAEDYSAEVAELALTQAMACIGCNDCMLACPISQSRNVTIAELNAAVHLPTISDPRVADFVTACTQCGQCVPACPADLSRANMVLYNKMKVEDNVPDYDLLLQTAQGAMPSGWSLDELSEQLAELPLFNGASPTDLRRMVLQSTLRFLQPGEVLCWEGSFHERLFVVLEGSLEQSNRGLRGEHIRILVLSPGSFFGEMGVLADAPEPYTVHALERSIVVEVPKVSVIRLTRHAPTFKQTLEHLYQKRALWSYASNPGALGVLPEAAVEDLFANAKLQLVAAGETLFAQGTPPKDAFLVRSGFLRAKQTTEKGERLLVYFREGDVFGLLDFVENTGVRLYSTEGASRAEVIRIPGAVVQEVLAEYPDARSALMRGSFDTDRLARSPNIGWGGVAAHGQGGPSLHVLVEEGLAKGREVLVVDQTLCTNCQNCIDACGRRHGYSRLQLRGLQIDQYLFPTACRHCDDPACLMCSVNGIVRLPSGEIRIIEDNCIGCGACASRCPYGNISMHAVQKEKQGLWPRLMDFIAGGERERRAKQEVEVRTQRIAVKCDLCSGYSDYACVKACPVGAACRVDPAVAFADLLKEGGPGNA
ncbi:MAG: cyclic nucleotide-binding domain-containing protein [Polyangiaceae bacterium]|nr:cyclic nucleotide-binding domain-containing protein [Polyangiaceae bacterium]MCB9608657.1 cyclic nucleotide-binding domain-containing protein [Polyangiaceae bacterium]